MINNRKRLVIGMCRENNLPRKDEAVISICTCSMRKVQSLRGEQAEKEMQYFQTIFTEKLCDAE